MIYTNTRIPDRAQHGCHASDFELKNLSYYANVRDQTL